MKILSAPQFKELDTATLHEQSVSTADLIKRAATAFVNVFTTYYPDELYPNVAIFCGVGNNGGDGVAIARLLAAQYYNVSVYYCKLPEEKSEQDALLQPRIHKHRLPVEAIHILQPDTEMPPPLTENVIIDAIYGTGFRGEPSEWHLEVFKYLNSQAPPIVAVDIPSGLYADRATPHEAVRAAHTLTFHCPKLAFLLPKSFEYVGEWEVLDIKLSAHYMEKTTSPYHWLMPKQVAALHKRRRRFDHKGTFGHAMLIVGSYGKMGAAILAGRACLRSGAGLLTIHSPKCGYNILQSSLPEAMVSVDFHEYYFTRIKDVSPYTAIGVGCGIATQLLTANALEYLLKHSAAPMVLDADALNLMAVEQKLLKLVPPNSILTPHPKEFSRLFGDTADDFARLALQREKAKEYKIYILLKGAHSCLATPDGTCYFNSTGNPGMATAGSGDVLTGMLTGLLAQHYTPLEAALMGMYLHGAAGDMAAAALGHEALLAGDIIEGIGKAFQQL